MPRLSSTPLRRPRRLALQRPASWLLLFAAFGCDDDPAQETRPDAAAPPAADAGPVDASPPAPDTEPPVADAEPPVADAEPPVADAEPPVEWPADPAGPPFARHVDPFIGTGGIAANVGCAYPGATAPFGLVKASPDTGSEFGAVSFRHNSGYHASDREIYGFSHNHLHGTGVPDYGNILVMPTVGMSPDKTEKATFRTPFDPASEVAAPGYYAVTLDSAPTIRAELTATTRCAHHRYTWAAPTDDAVVVLDLGAALVDGRTRGGTVAVDAAAGTVEGSTHNVGVFSGRYDGFPVYFSARVRQAPTGHGTWLGDDISADRAEIETDADPAQLGAWLRFDVRDEPTVEVQLCLSYTSLDAARAALGAELPEWDFDATRAATEAAWEADLSSIEVYGGTEEHHVDFYTALYHVMQMPTIWTDVDGRYRGFDGEVHQADGWTYYTDLSLWDTFRTQHPLIAVLWPERQRDMMQSLAAMRDQGGYVPKWPMGMGDTGSMIGQPGAIVVADTWLKGIRDFDIETLYEGLKQTADMPPAPGSYGNRGCGMPYQEHGFCPADHQNDSVSITQELAYADFCLAELADALGHAEDAARYRARSLNHRNLLDPETRFFRPKMTDGSWKDRFRPTDWHLGEGDYTEGTAWQWRWYALHDEDWLHEALGGRESFLTELTTFFEKAAERFTFEVPGSYYYHGNEPDLHAPFLFIRAGRPDLTQRWTRWILETNYRTDRGGIIGNDDAGTLAAWYVLAASGIYPWPCRPGYYVTRPLFEKVVWHLPGGDVVIEAPGASNPDGPPMIAEWNGEVLADYWLSHEKLAAGGTLRFRPVAE